MLNTIEFILKILFFILSIIWIGKIMILRTDKQIVINPLLIGIASILAVLPQSNNEITLIRIILYCIYSIIVILGIYAMNQRNGIF